MRLWLRLWVSLQAIWLIFNTFSCLCCQLSTSCHASFADIACKEMMKGARQKIIWGELVNMSWFNVLTVFPALNRRESFLGGLMTHFLLQRHVEVWSTLTANVGEKNKLARLWFTLFTLPDSSCPEQHTLTSHIRSPQGLWWCWRGEVSHFGVTSASITGVKFLWTSVHHNLSRSILYHLDTSQSVVLHSSIYWLHWTHYRFPLW